MSDLAGESKEKINKDGAERKSPAFISRLLGLVPKLRWQYPAFGSTVYSKSLHCSGKFDDCRVDHMECCGEWGRPAFLLPCPDVTGRPFRQ